MSRPLIDLVTKIRSRGYWHVVIRPETFDERRVSDYSALYPLVQRRQARLQGWEYPPIEPNLQRDGGPDWVGQHIEWQHFLEVWRIFQSCQFVHLFGMVDDWLDQSQLHPAPEGWRPGVELDVAATLSLHVAIFSFAARLAQSIAGSDPVRVAVTANGLVDRRLASQEFPLKLQLRGTRCAMPMFPYVRGFPRAQLIDAPKALALEAASELFKRFDWNPSQEVLRSILTRRLL